MDTDLKQFLNDLTTGLESKIGLGLKDLRDDIRKNADRSLKEHEATRREVAHIDGKVNELWRKVNGSDPPPPEPGGGLEGVASGDKPRAPMKSVGDTLDQHDGKLDEQDGKIAGLTGHFARLDGQVADLHTTVKRTLVLQEQQIKAMGIREKLPEESFGNRLFNLIGWMVKEREGQKFALGMFAAMTSLITALGTTYALTTGRLPLPTSVVAPHVPPPLGTHAESTPTPPTGGW